MTAPGATPNWWQRYLNGEFATPQEMVRAAWEEAGASLTSAPFPFFDEETPTVTVPDRLVATGWFNNTSYLRQLERADWTHADPRLMVWSALFLQLAKKRGIPLYVHSCLRGKAEQDALAAKGNSKLRYPSSAHNIGEAVDIVHGCYHWNMTPDEWKVLNVIGNLALDRLNATLKRDNKLDLTWGGSWSFYDPAHYEIRDYRQRLRRLSDPAIPKKVTPAAILAQRGTLLSGL